MWLSVCGAEAGLPTGRRAQQLQRGCSSTEPPPEQQPAPAANQRRRRRTQPPSGEPAAPAPAQRDAPCDATSVVTGAGHRACARALWGRRAAHCGGVCVLTRPRHAARRPPPGRGSRAPLHLLCAVLKTRPGSGGLLPACGKPARAVHVCARVCTCVCWRVGVGAIVRIGMCLRLELRNQPSLGEALVRCHLPTSPRPAPALPPLPPPPLPPPLPLPLPPPLPPHVASLMVSTCTSRSCGHSFLASRTRMCRVTPAARAA